ncbi:MAG: PH domain-containing protein [Gemmatimonadaceae bacterium]
MTTIRFRSKVDVLISIVILTAIGVSATSVAKLLTTSHQNWLGAALLAIVSVGLPAWLFLSTSYVLTDYELRVKSGPFNWCVPLNTISAVTKTRSSLAAPAWSFDRLLIEYESGRSVMVSPSNQEAFVQELEKRRASAGLAFP